MYPPLLMMHAEMSKRLIATRFRTIAAAADNANRTGYHGLRYPWTSAFTGKFIEVSCKNRENADEFHFTYIILLYINVSPPFCHIYSIAVKV